jgi:hypothetical protein
MSSHREAPGFVRDAWTAAQSDPILKQKLLDHPRQTLVEQGAPQEHVQEAFSNHPTEHMTEDHWNHWTSPADHHHDHTN